MMPTPANPTTPSDKTPSPESDRHQPEKPNSDNDDDDSAGIGRSYECTFCKRGFTNAQALGGHMNIHRKDKAKAKAKPKFAAATNHQDHHCSSTKSSENYTNNLRYNYPISPIGHHQDQKSAYYYMPGAGQVNYQVYLPSSNPNSQIGDFGLQPVLRPADGSVDRPNLSLRIGQSEPDEDRGKNGEGNDVDLELRLGHDP